MLLATVNAPAAEPVDGTPASIVAACAAHQSLETDEGTPPTTQAARTFPAALAAGPDLGRGSLGPAGCSRRTARPRPFVRRC